MRHYRLKKCWSQIELGMTLQEAERIMKFQFNLDSENKKGRIVYSNHEKDYLPFYIVIDKMTDKIIRKREIQALDELY
ncbi:MAG: Putative integron gene cassette protein (Fragment) [uncultured Sulfurovum sp.]|uniref:Integron gene cassette protein n=1 Tax=uncultured Sulfurovum sp. TaxID=269237 RepID=A0A6S6U9J3_9BACT